MVLRIALLAGWICISTANAQPAADRLDEIITSTLKIWDVPGLSVVVVSDDRIVYAKGFGKRSVNDPQKVDPDTLFPLASCTKAFTSALMARLVDDGTMNWDDPLSRHLPKFQLPDPEVSKLLTMRDLFGHGSGIGGHDLLWYHAPWDLKETVRRMQWLPLAGKFRGSYHYSSLPYIVAGQAMEQAAGKPWEQLLREKIIQPLNLSSAAFTTEQAMRSTNRAEGHEKKNGKIVPMSGFALREPNPAGSLYLNANDVAAWIRFQLANGHWNGKPIISAKNLQLTRSPQTLMPLEGEMLAVYPESKKVHYAMGWVVFDYRGETVIAHGGILDGFRTQITLLPERKLGFALMNNLHRTRMNIALSYQLIDAMAGLTPRDWNAYFQRWEAEEARQEREQLDDRARARRADLKPTFELSAAAGTYEHPAFGTAAVVELKGKLTLKWSSFQIPLEHWQGNEFRAASGFFENEIIRFMVRDNRAAAVQLREMTFTRK